MFESILVCFSELTAFRQALAGGLTGFAQLVVTVPMELLKIQLQDAGRVALMEAKIIGNYNESK